MPPLRERIKRQLDSVIHSARIAGLRDRAKTGPEQNLRRSKATLLALLGPRTSAAVSWGRLVARIRFLEAELAKTKPCGSGIGSLSKDPR